MNGLRPVRRSDVEVIAARTEFRQIDLQQPFVISGRTIAWFTLAVVEVVVRDRAGSEAAGRGTSILSVPWSWPGSALPVEDRDAVLRALTTELGDTVGRGTPADPVRHWREAHDTLAAQAERVRRTLGVIEPVPRLAALLALGAVDNAVHDAWSRVAGRPAHLMYDGEHLDDHLGELFGAAFAGRSPGEFLRTAALPRLPVQHLAGVTDPLTSGEAAPGRRSLDEWLRTEGLRHVKIKVEGTDPTEDAHRVAAVHRLGRDAGVNLVLAVDPNEGYPDPAAAVDMLEQLAALDPAASRALGYLEQPIPRDSSVSPARWGALNGGLPVVMDEGFTEVAALPRLRADGWSGVVIKAGKGHSAALLTQAYARLHELFVTVQDLTAVDAAFAHSARLVSLFELSSPHLEYNSRQYAPHANDDLARSVPGLTTVRDGHVELAPPNGPGIC